MNDRNPKASQLLPETSFQEFVPLDHEYPIPEPPLESFPPVLGDWIEEAKRAFQVPVDLPMTQVLAALSIAGNGLGTVETGGDWNEGLNLWLLTILPSGSNKSAVQAASLEPIRNYAEQERERMAPEMARQREAQKVAADKYEAMRRSFRATKSSPGKNPGHEDLENLAVLFEKANAQLDEPPVYIMRNATTEAIEERLSLDEGIGALVSDESEILANATGRYSNGANFDSLLPAHSGGSIDSVRKGKPIIVVKQARLAISMVVQPVVLEKLASLPGDVEERGFVGRFLIVNPEWVDGSRVFEDVPIPDGIKTGYDSLLVNLLRRRREGPHLTFSLSEAARVSFRLFFRSLEVRLKPGADLAGCASWVSKLEGACLRLSGLLHLAWHGTEYGTVISGETMRRAQDLAYWFLAHLINAHRVMHTDPEIRDALKLWDFIIRHAKMAEGPPCVTGAEAVISRRDLGQVAKGTFRTQTALEGPLQLLIQQGYVSTESIPSSSTNRKTRAVLLNPEAVAYQNPSPLPPLEASRGRSGGNGDGFVPSSSEGQGTVASCVPEGPTKVPPVYPESSETRSVSGTSRPNRGHSEALDGLDPITTTDGDKRSWIAKTFGKS